MEVRTFQPADLFAIAVQPSQSNVHDAMKDPNYGEALKKAGPCFTATSDGEVMICAGVITQWHGNDRAWAILSWKAGKCMFGITRQIRRWLKFNNHRRVDCAVDCGFPDAIRWAELLGFECEGRMRAYTPEGRDCFLYARIV